VASIPRQRFPDDDGSADAGVAAALSGYAAGRVGERAVLAAIAGTRLLVPVVAVLTDSAVAEHGLKVEKESDMALPLMVGTDGRRAVPGFTSTDSLKRWRADARPVAVSFRQACQAVLAEKADALIVDAAGPVPFALDGERLRALAEGAEVPPAHRDPHVLAAVQVAVSQVPGIARIKVGPGQDGAELSVGLLLTPEADADADATAEAVRAASARLAEHLTGNVIGGVHLEVIPR
jgi:hypothetical protein